LDFAILILENFFFKILALFLFLGERIIPLMFIFALKIHSTTEVAIFPMPIKPNFIFLNT